MLKPKPKSQTEHQAQRATEKETAKVQEAKTTLFSLCHQLKILRKSSGKVSREAAEAQLEIIKNLLADCEFHRKAAVELWLDDIEMSAWTTG